MPGHQDARKTTLEQVAPRPAEQGALLAGRAAAVQLLGADLVEDP
jgi:hypothetical protein